MIFECPHCRELIEISEKTNPQLRYLHLIFKLCGEKFGYSTEQMKILLKKHFGHYTIFANKITGEEVPEFKSLARFTKSEMTEFIQNVYYFANEHSVNVLSPEEYYLKIKQTDEKTDS